MKKTITSLFTILLLTVLFSFDSGTASWKLTKENDNIQMFHKWVNLLESQKTRAMKVTFFADATPQKVLECLKNPEDIKQWSHGIEKCERHPKTTTEWTTYTLFKIPGPFDNKDLVSVYNVKNLGTRGIVIDITSSPDALPTPEDVQRIREYNGTWTLTPKSTGGTNVTFEVISFTEPILPRWIQDPIVQSTFMKSIKNLRTLAESK